MARLTNTRALARVERALLVRGLLPASVAQVLASARRLAASLGTRPLVKATRADLRLFLAGLEASVGATTQATYLRRLRLLYRVLVDQGLAAKNPTEGLRLMRAHASPRLVLGDEAVRRLLVAASEVVGDGPLARARALRDRCCLELLFGLALRSIEARTAKLVDLDLRDGSLFVRRAKRGQPERLPLPRPAVPHVLAWLNEGRPLLAKGEDQGALLLRDDGRPFHRTGIGKLVTRVVERAGVPAHPHAFRRAAATGLVRAGASVPVVQRVLGHVSLTSTAVYCAVPQDDLRAVVEVLDRARRS